MSVWRKLIFASNNVQFRIQMKKTTTDEELISEWKTIPTRIRKSIRGLSEEDLNVKGGSEGWTIRETVHHLVEANLVASNMIIAALAVDGCDYDWTWVNPDKAWMRRVGYDTADIDLAIKALLALSRHISALLAANTRTLARTVKLNDAPGRPRYVASIRKILCDEVEHAKEHLGEIRNTRKVRPA